MSLLVSPDTFSHSLPVHCRLAPPPATLSVPPTAAPTSSEAEAKGLGRAEVGEDGHLPADTVKVVHGEVHFRLVGQREEVQHRVRGAAQRVHDVGM